MIPPRPSSPITLAKLLLVEGNTPMHFFEALLRHLGLSGGIEVHNFGGVPDLNTFLRTLVVTPGFGRVTSVGIVRDAEDKLAASARQSVSNALAAVGLSDPTRTPPVRTAVFILPDDTHPGMIETLCMRAVEYEPSLTGVFRCVEDFFACLGRNGVPLPSEPALAKNRAQAYLATRPDTQLFPGLAAYRGYWPWGSPAFQPLVQFLQAL